MAKVGSITEFERFDDATLVRYVQTREIDWRTAASALLVRHRHAVLRRCWARLGDQFDAEDALQETLLRAFRAIGGFKGEAEFKSWLYVIADNQCHTLVAQRARHQMSDHIRALIEIHLAAHDRSSCEDCRQSADVQAALNRMSAPDREILALRFYGELSIEDLASTFGIKLSAVKMRLYRALDRFEDAYRRLCQVEAKGCNLRLIAN